jgi:hypothetical protein
MAGRSKHLWIVLAAFGAMPAFAQPTEPAPVHYDIGLDVTQGEVEAITVRAKVRTGDDGIVDFSAPMQPPAEVHAEQGVLETTTAGRWRVTAEPGTEVVVAWRTVRPDPIGDDFYHVWRVVVSQPGTVVAAYANIFARPRGAETRSVTVATTLPPGWQASSTPMTHAGTVNDIDGAFFVASRQLRTVTRDIRPGSMLHVYTVGGDPAYDEKAATAMASTLGRMEKPPGAPADFSITIVTTGTGEGWGSSATGSDAFVIIPRTSPSNPWPFNVLRSFVDADGAAAGKTPQVTGGLWFTKGVALYRLERALKQYDVVDNLALARHLDGTITGYGNSPVRRATNARVVEDVDRIRDMRDVVVSRGELFAWLIDGRIREATQGRQHLVDALDRMDTRTNDPGPALIAAVAAEGGGDITSLYQRYIVDGELLQLPRTALGPCFTIGTVAAPDGWQIQHVFAKPAPACPSTPPAP